MRKIANSFRIQLGAAIDSVEDVAGRDLWLAEAGRLQRDVGVLFGREGVPLPYVVAVWIAVIMELGVDIALILGFLTRPLVQGDALHQS